MKQCPIANKEDALDLNELALEKIRVLGSNQIISFREITKFCGVVFHLKRKETFRLLKNWEQKKLIKIHPFNGVEVLE